MSVPLPRPDVREQRSAPLSRVSQALRAWAVASVLVLSSLLALASAQELAAPGGVIGAQVDDFALLDQAGRQQQLSRQAGFPVVVLYAYAAGCPIARQDLASLKDLAAAHAAEVRIWLIDATPDEDRRAVLAELQELGSPLTVLYDPAQIVVHPLGIDRTGEALVIDTATSRLLWRGPVDDRLGYGSQKAEASRQYLLEAIQAALAHHAVPATAPAAKGCRITLLGEQRRCDYAADIAPIIESRCATCHRSAGIAPFALASAADVIRHAAMIRDVVRTRRMPPWQAEAAPGSFLNQGDLTPDQQRMLVRWIESEPHADGGADPLATVRPAIPGWPLGKPDLIVDCPAQGIPANGTIPYRCFTVPLDIPQDAWVCGFDLRPSEVQVMHHAFAFIVKPGEAYRPRAPQFTGLNGFFANYVPGNPPAFLPAGTGILLPKGSQLAFQIHYTTNGVATVDHPRLALYFQRQPPAHELRVGSALKMNFVIPPGDGDVTVSASRFVPVPITVYALAPHMHLRGSWMSYTVRYPDGRTQPLLTVPHYDFNWQFQYRLASPLRLPAGSSILVDGGFDNSRFNDLNPDATRAVYWGEQSWQEMFIGFVMFSVD